MSKNLLLYSLFLLLTGSLHAQNVQYYLDQGIQAYRTGEYERALRAFDRVIQIDRQHSEGYLYRGNTQFVLGRYANAERDYTSALEHNYRSRPESTGGSFRAEGMTIVEPDPAARDNDVYALLYNNRGASRYLQGKRQEAMADFDLALEFSPGFGFARQNIEVTTGIADGGSPVPSFPVQRGLDRPQDPLIWDDVDQLTTQSENLRAYRANGRISGLAGLFQPRPFQKRTIPRRGKVYKEPSVSSATQRYIHVSEVTITDRETLVTIVIKNDERRSFYARIFPPGRPESYVLVDRNPDARRGVRYELLDVSDEEITETTGVMIRPEDELSVTLTFRKLDDDVGYVHLIEGSLQVDEAWNFYHIDLTR